MCGMWRLSSAQGIHCAARLKTSEPDKSIACPGRKEQLRVIRQANSRERVGDLNLCRTEERKQKGDTGREPRRGWEWMGNEWEGVEKGGGRPRRGKMGGLTKADSRGEQTRGGMLPRWEVDS